MLKIKEHTGHKRTLTIQGTFKVGVYHRTRIEQEKFSAEGDGLGEDENALRQVKFFLDPDDVRGLTPEIAADLGIALSDDQPTEEIDGVTCLPKMSVEELAQVWRHAYAQRFAMKVAMFSRDMLTAIVREKAQAKND